MDTIKIYVEELIRLCGISGSGVPIVRHALLVLVAVLLAWMAGVLCRRIFVPLIHKLTSRTNNQWDEVLLNDNVLVTACRIIPAIVIWQLLPLVFYQYPAVREVLTRFTAIYIVVMSVRLFITFLTSVTQLELSRSSSVRQYINTFCGVIKILVIFLAVIIVVAILFDKNPMSLIAGLGATSAILMLVFKDTIEGLVAGIRLTSNDMVKKGDWITVPSTPADGIVEEISLTTVKVRNFDNTTVTVPPLTLVNGSFQNWRSMQRGAGRRVKRLLFVDFRSVKILTGEQKNALAVNGYFTTDELKGEVINVALFRTYIEKYLSSRKEVNEKMTLIVRQMEATQCGLPLEVLFFIKNDKQINYEHTLADIIEHIYAYTNTFGLTIYQQYPEQ
ncbi:transporter, small conductance mechanosensitive ion channel MscS family protein [Hoylesella saccharolytica F0055]|jgi:mechanosensitive ion channel family protein|uniref:Transporter, small conductance mechanosensitive ion channel MscS family protein n=1 Tax=Hoylesella saccharolytica F0055 TaxID=1127699 RepID=L1N1W7_9BACT|nr:mechanosensitive ion channel domain-containing protein [Hoylesella saccharolytica]EKX97340.1 transporter, small conductance mechanosensitive ion channel MscS family protein [Hoylesella saccharolytica F0055]